MPADTCARNPPLIAYFPTTAPKHHTNGTFGILGLKDNREPTIDFNFVFRLWVFNGFSNHNPDISLRVAWANS